MRYLDDGAYFFFAELCLKTRKTLAHGKHIFLIATSLPRCQTIHTFKMSPFLLIASRVEATIAAYTSIRDFADKQVWKEHFNVELVSVHLHGNQSLYI